MWWVLLPYGNGEIMDQNMYSKADAVVHERAGSLILKMLALFFNILLNW